MNILILEDDYLIAESIKNIFRKISIIHIIDIAHTFDEAFQKSFLDVYDLVFVDINLDKDELDGLDLCKIIRKNHEDVPIIVVTSCRSVETLEKAFKIGVNEYITKPFHPKELELRTYKCLFSQYKSILNKTIVYHELTYNLDNNEFYYNNRLLELTKKSKFLLLIFLKEPEKILTTHYIQEKLWGDYDLLGKTRNVRSNIQILNKVLKKHYCNWISNIRGEGYILNKFNKNNIVDLYKYEIKNVISYEESYYSRR